MARLIIAVIAGLLAVGPLPAAAQQSEGPPLPPPPKTWANLRWTPAQPVNTLGGPSSAAALAAADRLYLAEIFRGGVYLSELDPTAAAASWTIRVAAAVEGRERSNPQLAVIGQEAWVAWLEGSEGTALERNRALMLAAVDLGRRQAKPPAEMAATTAAAISGHNQQVWLAWLGPAEGRTINLSAGPQESGFVVPWQPSVPGRPVGLALGDLGADLCLPFLAEQQGRESLWLAAYNGHRFHGVRKIRGAGDLAHPTVSRLRSRLVVMYTVFPDAEDPDFGAGNLEMTVTNLAGSELASEIYLADGRVNLYPSLAAIERTLYVAYTAWEGRPGRSEEAKNLGVFLGKIESEV